MDDDDVPPLVQAKILVLKICRRRCLVHAQSDSASEVAEPVLKLMITMLENGGSIEDHDDDEWVPVSIKLLIKILIYILKLICSPGIKSRLRLQAAWSLVQLAVVPKLNEALNPNFVLLAITVQESVLFILLEI